MSLRVVALIVGNQRLMIAIVRKELQLGYNVYCFLIQSAILVSFDTIHGRVTYVNAHYEG